MRKFLMAGAALALASTLMMANTSAHAAAAPARVEFETMTWPEVKAALAAGKTTALIYTGGVEQRGPQNANGGHNLMARAIVKEIALKLGNAIAMPVLPFTPNQASAEMPGTIGLTNELLEGVLERIAEQTITNGFKNVVLMGDHGGGQAGPNNVYAAVAKKLDAKYSPQGVHVFYCDQVYMPANNEFDKQTEKEGYPASMHGGLSDTSLMLYLDKDGTWTRKDELKNAHGIPVVDGKPKMDDPKAVKNGIVGDGTRSTPELGKRLLDLKVDYAVKQINGFIPKK
ncbi:MAG: creatininase family protein [Rhodospirillaceae bacterium]|nr:creatininase family protein [Rhodospirillaceae bacterium]